MSTHKNSLVAFWRSLSPRQRRAIKASGIDRWKAREAEIKRRRRWLSKNGAVFTFK